MKTLILILVVLLGTTGVVLIRAHHEVHRTCSCSGALCSCDATCLDYGEMPSCTCGALTCVCKCVPKDANNAHFSMPTMNADQQANSKKSEVYFRGLNTPATTAIADGLKTLREAILANNSSTYQTTASIVESTYAGLPQTQKSAWETWSSKNLKK